MRNIDGKVFTYAEHPPSDFDLREGVTKESFGLGNVEQRKIQRLGPTWAPVAKIREWPGYPVDSYEALVKAVAHVASGNRLQHLYFRGQTRDHKDRNGRSTVYSSICRPQGHNLSRSVLAARCERLRAARELLLGHAKELGLTHRIHRYPEAAWALLQHYEVCPTPLIDVTGSLRVAASFALMNDAKEGFLYVLGLPFPHGSISHLIDHEILIVRLQSVCPYEALRPHFQEGILIGRYPWTDQKQMGDNAAYRMIAKFKLVNDRNRFWNRGFTPIPKDVLLPTDDPFGEKLRGILAPVLGA